jgi:DNA repair protein RadA/Sms
VAKSSSQFICQQCGAVFPRWQGQCGSCEAWGSLVEEAKPTAKAAAGGDVAHMPPAELLPFSRVELASASEQRIHTPIGELDRVLGGGVVPGMVVLVGGEPGIGKSTLLTQLVLQWPVATGKILYVCGEESPQQIALRINRLSSIEHIKKAQKKGEDIIFFITSTNVDEVVSAISEQKPSLVIVDSIQTITTMDLSGAEGSVGQIRESTQRLTEVAKRTNTPMFLVGHVTKEGAIAGPKVLEHIVDTVLELSGERTGQVRILRAIKNRFGATDEVGVFRHSDAGLEQVLNPSDLFLEHQATPLPGSAVVGVMEGTRPLLVEVQALVVPSQLAMPRRVGRGIELNRIQVLSAVLQKHCRLPLGTADIFVSAAGGFAVREPAVDLGLAVAVVSSLHNKPLPPQTVCIGEIGLLGEIRAVSYLDQRIKEAKRLGFTNILSRQSHSSIREVLRELGMEKSK